MYKAFLLKLVQFLRFSPFGSRRNIVAFTKMLQFMILLCALHDPERIIDRMQHSIEESLDMFRSYANSQRLIEDHEELIHIYRRVEKISHELGSIAKYATH